MTHLKIDYVEFCSPAFHASRDFFANAFGWSFHLWTAPELQGES